MFEQILAHPLLPYYLCVAVMLAVGAVAIAAISNCFEDKPSRSSRCSGGTGHNVGFKSSDELENEKMFTRLLLHLRATDPRVRR